MSIDIDELITCEVVVPTSQSSIINDAVRVFPFNWLLATESENYILTESGDLIIV